MVFIVFTSPAQFHGCAQCIRTICAGKTMFSISAREKHHARQYNPHVQRTVQAMPNIALEKRLEKRSGFQQSDSAHSQGPNLKLT